MIDSIASIRDLIRIRVIGKRRAAKYSQVELAQRSGVSLGSLKRFEQSGEIALTALIKIAFTLGEQEDCKRWFASKHYQTLVDLLNDPV